MYRVMMIAFSALALAGCSSSPDWMKTPDWMSLDSLKPAPVTDTVRFESEPPGAEARTSSGQTCRTPCALALQINAPLTVTFSLSGYQSETETIEPIANAGSPTQLRPNPVVVELTPAPPPAKKPPPPKKPDTDAKAKPKPKARPKPAAAPAAAAPPAPQQQQTPWPAPQPQR